MLHWKSMFHYEGSWTLYLIVNGAKSGICASWAQQILFLMRAAKLFLK